MQDQLKDLAKHPEFYWWLGQVWHVFHALLYFTSVLSLSAYAPYYQRAYLGSLISFGVILWRPIGVSRSLCKESLCNENVHYFVLAFYWYSCQPITVTLVPYFVYSVFHALGYLHSTVIPALFPTSGPSTATQLCNTIKRYTDAYHNNAMQFAAYAEVTGIMGRLILGAVTFRTSILAPIIYGHFLRLRWYNSHQTQEAVQFAVEQLDRHLLPPTASPRVPQFVCNLYANTKGFIVRWRGMTFWLIMFLLCWTTVLAITHLVAGAGLTGQPVPIELFVMSKCPDKVYCESVMADVFEQVRVPIQLDINYIATHDDDQPFEHTCMHGNAECLGNIEELCFRHVYPQQEDWFGFAQCVNKRYKDIGLDTSVSRDCAHQLEKHFEPVRACSASPLGIQLLHESEQRTKRLGASKSCTIFVNHKLRCVRDGQWKECEEGHDVQDFVKTIENAFQQAG